MATTTEAARALARAVAFLERAQLPSGELPVQASGRDDPSVFPTALAAHALSFAPAASGIRERALSFLVAEMDKNGLWKHWPRTHPLHHRLPPDLDDTSCAAAALMQAGWPCANNRRRLLANRNRHGLFYTWTLARAQFRHPFTLLAFFRTTSAKPFDVDAVVNANVLHYLGGSPDTAPVVEHLLRVLRDGRERMCDKWYDNPFVVWYFFSRALRRVSPEAGAIIERNIADARPASALERALAICCRHDWSSPQLSDAALDAEVAALIAAQQTSGAWPAAPLYHGGRARRRDGSFAEPHPDTPSWGSESLTTAFAIEALARWLERS